MRSELPGLVGVADPLRPGVPEAVRACTGAGIRVAMITGDHPAKAAAIARQASIPAERVLTGSEMSEMDNAALREAIQHVFVFARVMPEPKLRLVQAFAGEGEVVVMTGDGGCAARSGSPRSVPASSPKPSRSRRQPWLRHDGTGPLGCSARPCPRAARTAPSTSGT
jgi:high-affinity K+ transport system ATPase subunit B